MHVTEKGNVYEQYHNCAFHEGEAGKSMAVSHPVCRALPVFISSHMSHHYWSGPSDPPQLQPPLVRAIRSPTTCLPAVLLKRELCVYF